MQKRSRIREVDERQEEERRHTENDDVEIEGHFNTEENSQENLVLTTPDQRAMLQDRAHTKLESLNDDRVTLDVVGRNFATSRKTLFSDNDSIIPAMLQTGVNHYTIDLDGGHFRYILNYLRAEVSMSLASLPSVNRYLLELKNESIYYYLPGLEALVSKRLEMYHALGFAF